MSSGEAAAPESTMLLAEHDVPSMRLFKSGVHGIGSMTSGLGACIKEFHLYHHGRSNDRDLRLCTSGILERVTG